ncbi:glycerate kinase [Glutamicibacter mishrai]|uniref:glycerate kinase n=1 Tax=Glutamicibacter mishrai TaxID=1775880 RepID=UPI0020CD42A5|nr:glycerate kinase [Glutamicibacter mishrai]UTT40676.1 glycerate kinase [Glutamicibacter mishrai]
MQTDTEAQQGSSVSARLRIVGWIVLTTAVALLAATVTMRSIMTALIAEAANVGIAQEIDEFRTFAAEALDPTTAQPFTSMHSLMERYLARQQPMAGEAILDSGLAGIDLDSMLRGADLVITAEGAIDFQTLKGKVPAEVACRASLHGVPVVALAGTLGRGCRDVRDIGIDAIASIMPIPMTLQEAVDDGERLLIEAAERFMRTIILGASMAAARLSPRAAW